MRDVVIPLGLRNDSLKALKVLFRRDWSFTNGFSSCSVCIVDWVGGTCCGLAGAGVLFWRGGFGVAGFGVGVVGISRLYTCSNGRDESSVVEKLWSGFISNS